MIAETIDLYPYLQLVVRVVVAQWFAVQYAEAGYQDLVFQLRPPACQPWVFINQCLEPSAMASRLWES